MGESEIRLKAIKHKCIEDNDGEITLILKVSLEQKLQAFLIPTNVVLDLKIRKEDN